MFRNVWNPEAWHSMVFKKTFAWSTTSSAWTAHLDEEARTTHATRTYATNIYLQQARVAVPTFGEHAMFADAYATQP